MKIVFRVDGGFAIFPGLAKPVSIDVDALPAAQGATLRDLVVKADFFDRPEAHAPAAQGVADMRKYVVDIEDGGRRRELVIPEAGADADLAALVRALDAQRRTMSGR